VPTSCLAPYFSRRACHSHHDSITFACLPMPFYPHLLPLASHNPRDTGATARYV